MFVGSSIHTVGPDMASDLEANVLRWTKGTFHVLASVLKKRMLYAECSYIQQFSQVFWTFAVIETFKNNTAAAVAQWVRAFAPQAEGWVFESQPRQT